jgi:hypothetical protein
MYLVGTLTTGASQNNFEYIYTWFLKIVPEKLMWIRLTMQEVNPDGRSGAKHIVQMECKHTPLSRSASNLLSGLHDR